MKKAFTLLELVFVIVVIGILAAVIIPRTESNSLHEAATQVVSHIRYTQHLAMIEDKFDATDIDWYKERWQLMFRNTMKEASSSGSATIQVKAYTIFSDKESTTGTAPNGTPNTTNNEIALSPSNSNKFLSGGFANTIPQNDSKRDASMDLKGKYGVLDVDFSGGCSGSSRISFDHLGRPYFGRPDTANNPLEKVMTQKCSISICTVSDCSTVLEGGSKVVIVVEPETGYTHI